MIRNLRDSSTLVTLVRPTLRQMDTVLVDQAVEKFNLKRHNRGKIHARHHRFRGNTAGNAARGCVLQVCLTQVTVQTAWVERYLGPISTSFSPLPSESFGVSDSGSTCSGGRNNQRRTSFCSALRLLQPAGESRTDTRTTRRNGQSAVILQTHLSHLKLTCQLHIVAELSGD